PCLVPPPAPSSPPFSACCLPRAPPPTDASPLSLHDALPISADRCGVRHHRGVGMGQHLPGHPGQLSGGEGRLDEGVVGEMADYHVAGDLTQEDVVDVAGFQGLGKADAETELAEESLGESVDREDL